MARNQEHITRDRLDHLCLLVTDGTHDSPKLQPNGIPFIKGKHISGGFVDFDNCDYITLENHIKAIKRSKAEHGDTLFSNIGSVGDAAYINTRNEFSIKNVALFKPNPRVVDSKYLYYVVIGPKFKGELFAKRSGVAQPFFSLEMLRSHEVEYHRELNTQRKIAAILSAYDDLVENNLRRIKILEEMAQNLYREWFVKFRFPGHQHARLTDSSLGRIPEGWEVVTVEQIVERVPSGKKYDQKTVCATGTVPVLDQGRSGIIGYHDDELGVLASEDAPIIVFANHTCYQRLVMFSFSAIQNVLPFLPSSEYPRNIYWLHYATKDLVTFNDYKGHWPEFMAKELILPSSNACQQFGGFVEPITRLIFKMEKRNETLRCTRDLLLPRLISGEVDVSELDIVVPEEAAV